MLCSRKLNNQTRYAHTHELHKNSLIMKCLDGGLVYDAAENVILVDEWMLSYRNRILNKPNIRLTQLNIEKESTLFVHAIPRKWNTVRDDDTECCVCMIIVSDVDKAILVPCLHGFQGVRFCKTCAISLNGKTCPCCSRGISSIFTRNTSGTLVKL